MIRFKSISIKNFLSYGNIPTLVQLDNPGTTLIVGEDLDNTTSGTGSNGVGKSSIINALTYAIYDNPIADISKDKLVNNINKKNMEVTVDFEIGTDQYTIKRVRKSKAGAEGNYTHLYKNGADITPDSSRNVNKEIEQIVGIPYDLFVRIATFSTDLDAFFDLPTRSHYQANQTDIIEELFDLKTLSEKAEDLKKVITDSENSLQTQLNQVEQLKKEHERHTKQLSSAQVRVQAWLEQNQKEILQLQKKLKKIENVDVEQQHTLNTELKDINNELRETIQHQQEIEGNIRRATEKVSKWNKELVHLKNAKCPFCLQKYESKEAKITEVEADIAKTNNELIELTQKLEQIDAAIESLSVRHKDVKGNITVGDFAELLDIKGKSHAFQQKLAELQKATNPYTEPLQELEKVQIEPIDMDQINKLKRLIDHQKLLLKLLTKKDSFVRKNLLNRNIPYLNQRLAHYLTELGLAHTVEFTHEMTAQISEFGEQLDFGNLSKGQRARVNVALSFAFRDVLQNMHDVINVCLLDEILDEGLDAVGVQAAARMLKRKAREENLSVFIISHRDEIDGAFDRKMIIQRSKKFSYVRYEDG